MMAVADQDVAAVLSRKFQIQRQKLTLFWAFLHLTLALIVYVDLQDGALSRFLMTYSLLFWYIEFGIAAFFFANFVSDITTYLWSWLVAPLKVSEEQRRLLGIGTHEDAFKTQKEDLSGQQSRVSSTPANLDLSTLFVSSTPKHASSSSSSTPLWSPSSHSISDNSRLLSTSASSWAYVDGSPTPNSRRPFSSVKKSPMSAEGIIADERSFQKYLQEMEEKESRLVGSFSDTSTTTSVWHHQTSINLSDSFTPPKLKYQLATRSPQSSASHSEDKDASALRHGEVAWSKMGISTERVYSWMENLRKWICSTITRRIVAEIDAVNDVLKRQGNPDLQIGEVGLAILRQRAKGPHIPSLYVLLQYLEVTPNQEYLVQRLRELDKGGCMSEFRWNGGGTHKGKPWSDSLPTDSTIVMHLFFTYLDSRSPLHTSFPDGKPVSARHFCKTPDKLGSGGAKESFYIHQTNINPPHYQFVVGDDVWELQRGRNNMFHAMLLFLYHIKNKEDGMLNHINLGPSGLNILWVLDG